MRGDSAGGGDFWAPRTRPWGTDYHYGYDFYATPGQYVRALNSGVAQAFWGKSEVNNGVDITNGDWTTKMRHFMPSPYLWFGPKEVAAGDVVGWAVDMRSYYPNAPGMFNHVDVKVQVLEGGRWLYFDYGYLVNFDFQLRSSTVWGY